MKEENIKNFLKKTEFCDFTHPDIQRLVHKITKNCVNDKDKAIRSFYWVRDNILYRVGRWQGKASETLVEKEGACTNKANLLVALLRANNIPAGYGIMKVYGQRYLGPIAIPMLKKFISEISTHIYPLAYLNNKWIKCDPSDDKEFCENTSYFNHTTELVEWDGVKDGVLNLKKEDIIIDNYPVADIDHWMIKKPRRARGFPLKIANIFVRFARKNTQRVADNKELEILFKKWLKVNHPFYFYSLHIISWHKDFMLKFKERL